MRTSMFHGKNNLIFLQIIKKFIKMSESLNNAQGIWLDWWAEMYLGESKNSDTIVNMEFRSNLARQK